MRISATARRRLGAGLTAATLALISACIYGTNPLWDGETSGEDDPSGDSESSTEESSGDGDGDGGDGDGGDGHGDGGDGDGGDGDGGDGDGDGGDGDGDGDGGDGDGDGDGGDGDGDGIGCTTQIYVVAPPGTETISAGEETGNTRLGIELDLGSVLVGQTISCWTVWLRAASEVSGDVTAVVRRSSDDTVVATFNEVLDAGSMSTEFMEYGFTLAAPYQLQTGDRILIEYDGPSAVRLHIVDDEFDGEATRRTRYDGRYTPAGGADVVGTLVSP